VIKVLGNTDKDALYLFFIENVKGKDFNGDFAGYMPLGYQSGFIYDNPNAATVAHELAHGAFNLYHTFSNEKFVAAQSTTDNLMDYKGGTELWAYQWKLIHNPKNMMLKFLQEEEEGEFTHFNFYDYFWNQVNNEISAVKYQLASRWSRIKNFFTFEIDEKEVENIVENDPEKIKEILFGIKNVEKEYELSPFVINCDSSVRLDDETYKISLYCKTDLVSKVDKLNYTEESHENGYTLLSFSKVGNSSETILVIQVDSDKLEAFKKFLFGEEGEEIFLDNVQWVSQFNEMFKEPCGCWPTNDCNGRRIGSNQCCNRAANKILEYAGTSTNRLQQVVIAESNNPDCSNLTGIKTKFEEAVQIIDKSLKEHGLPILVGVHHPSQIKNEKGVIIGWEDKCSRNNPKITNHYIVVIGKKYDNIKRQYYYLFYEVGTGNSINGTSNENKLYINENNNLLEGNTAYQTDYTGNYYIVTEVRKNIGQTY